MINTQGGLTAKGLDHQNDTSINTFDWIAVSHVTENQVTFHHGGVRAEALAKHHGTVLELAWSHSWDIAVDYNILQREIVTSQPAHDISTLDLVSLTLIVTWTWGSITQPSLSLTVKLGGSPLKCASPHSDTQAGHPAKRPHSCCVQCGGSGHLPHHCTTESTLARHSPATITTNVKSKHALLAPNAAASATTLPMEQVPAH